MPHPLRTSLALIASAMLLTACGEQAGSDDGRSAAPQTIPEAEPASVPATSGTGTFGQGADSLNAASSRAGTQGETPADAPTGAVQQP